MKYCGCSSCKKLGEVNPYDLFEIYLAGRNKEFENIFLNSYNVGEMSDLYEELEPQFNNPAPNKINQKPFDAQHYWYSYGGSF